MALDFKFPDVGEGIHEGELVKWLVKEGDAVKADQAIAEVETDKAVVEVPCPRAGVMLKLHASAGQRILVGQVIATIGDVGEKYSGTAPQAVAPQAPAKPVSAAVTQAPKQVQVSAPQVAQVPQVMQVPQQAQAFGPVLATPSTRKMAREMGIEIEKVMGSGPGGRVTDQDLLAAAGKAPLPNASAFAGAGFGIGAPEKFDFEKEGAVERIALHGTRKVIAERMAKSFRTIPHAVHMDEVDVTELVKLRAKEKGEAAKKGAKLTFMPFIIKAVVFALRNNPKLNSSLDEITNEIVLKKYYNIGVAVDTEDGLVVVTIRNADRKNIIEIAQELEQMAEKARARKLAIEDIRGSSFTITNIGSLGGVWSMPIINYPNSSILGVHKIKERPVAVEGKVKVRSMLTLSLPFDHRIIDGADAARFLNDVMVHLEDPAMMLVDSI